MLLIFFFFFTKTSKNYSIKLKRRRNFPETHRRSIKQKIQLKKKNYINNYKKRNTEEIKQRGNGFAKKKKNCRIDLYINLNKY